MKKIFLLSIIFLIYSAELFPQSKLFSEGEELNYIVYYGFIKLGEVKMKLTGMKSENGKIIYYASSTMKSYKGIPFVSLNSIFETDMEYDGKDMYSKRFKATEYKDEGTVITEYKFNYDSQYVSVNKNNGGKVERDEKIRFNKNVKFQDGLSLFYEARLSSYSSDNFLIPVFMNEAETSVNYFFSTKPDDISIPLFDKDISSLRCNGVANFTGVFGLTGEFVGWFTNDDARIPVKAQMNVYIGSITLELDSYKRTGWKSKQ